MADKASLSVDGQNIELPVITGTENEKGIDIRKLRAQTGCITIDSGYTNTGSCSSGITFINGEKGILRYRGYPIEDLAQNSTFIEVAYLLIYGELPSQNMLAEFRQNILHHTLLHEDLRRFYDIFPRDAHPMALLSSVVCSLSTFYQDRSDPHSRAEIELDIYRILAKLPTIAAYSYKKSIGQPLIYPDNSLSYIGNFLNMMFGLPSEEYEIDPVVERTLDQLLILHADHEQNCSTSTVRQVGSSDANLYASISAGICALWGPLHGGANQKVLEMLEVIQMDGGKIDKYVELAKKKDSDFRLMGFGHRVYKNFDPRATIIKKSCDELLEKMGLSDPLLDIARQLEEVALKDEYFAERKLYPNVDFYSGIIYRAIGFPTDMFTVLFAIGRLPGWIAHWMEMRQDPDKRIGRPRQIYTGSAERQCVPMNLRG